MKSLIATTITFLLTGTTPTLAKNCCGGSKGKAAMMCGRGGTAMDHAGMKGEMGSL